ncbi:TBC1 domain family member 12-like [Dermacentor silvarum]|uniref:TBC1 domain family member 12-like n=1 Tax=Dermacentor silvarum TaxID=543639 RepID=UPI002100C090|nr:TBC1 domain family member 12-like [Dermacentor silvarum]
MPACRALSGGGLPPSGQPAGSGLASLDGALDGLALVYEPSTRLLRRAPPDGPSDSVSLTSGSSVSTDLSASDEGARQHGRLSAILTKGLLAWKTKSAGDERVPSPRDPSPTPSKQSADGCVPSSTTALILEKRPSNLPAKNPEEEQKHKQEYEEMVKAARKKELKDARARKKQMQQQWKQEEQLAQATRTWVSEVLPCWEVARSQRRTRDLWWQGLPPSVRGRVWKLAIGNELNITPELYEICASRSRKIWRSEALPEEPSALHTREQSAHLIRLDVSRTFPQLGIFQEAGPYFDVLHCILGAYVVYRPDIGYVQGMSFLAAMLLLNLEVADAFICFANLLNRPCQLAFFRVDQPQMNAYYTLYDDFFHENLPKLFAHFKKHNLTSDLYLVDWIYTLYSRSLPLDVACRVWDVFLRDGEEFLFRSALGILRLYEDVLLRLDFINLAQFLTKLPEDMSSDVLFDAIAAIRMTVNKRSFAQVLAKHRELAG